MSTTTSPCRSGRAGSRAGEIDRRIREVAEILSIVPLLPRRIQNLSGGQKQRVGIGRAIVREPRLFIMDEPISHLEARLRADMRTELKRLHRRLGVTTLYVTHDQLEAVALADRIAVMQSGVLQQVGTPSELFDQPANEFVAGFIGSPPMNILDFPPPRSTARTCCSKAPALPSAFRQWARGCKRDSRRRRPQARHPAGGCRAAAAGRQRDDARQGAPTRAARRPRPVSRRLSPRKASSWKRPTSVAGASGDTVGLFFPPARVHLFEGASGRPAFRARRDRAAT